MKALKISMFAIALGLMSFAIKPAMTEPVVKEAKGSAIVWKSESIDLGEIPQGKPKDLLFEFTNNGKTAVIITNVKPACGCTAADYTKTPIQPGEVAKINATYNAAAKGAFSKTITVTTNADDAPKVLTFKGTVI